MHFNERSWSPRASRRTIGAYNRIAHRYANLWFDDPIMEPSLCQFLDNIHQAGPVLDVGCGPGRDVGFMQSRGYIAVGIDASTKMVAEARRRVSSARFEHMDMRKLRFPDSTFAGVWACASILHLDSNDLNIAFSEFYRILKPDGVVFVVVKHGVGAMVDDNGRYFRLFTPPEIELLLDASGFSVLTWSIEKGRPRPGIEQTWIHAIGVKGSIQNSCSLLSR